MNVKVVTGGILEKDGKFLLVQENQKKCKNQWNVPAGGLEENESLIEGAKREIYEETGCEVEITGILEIVNKILEGVNVVGFFFDTKIINENIKANGEEILNVSWFSYEEILNMKDKLRADGYFLNAIKKKISNKAYPLETITINKK